MRAAETIFIAGGGSTQKLSKNLQESFALSPVQVVTNKDATALYEAMSTGKWALLHRLDASGDFAFSVELEFPEPIDPGLFQVLADRSGFKVAYPVDDEAPNDFRYHIASPSGLEIRELGFEDTDDSVICRMIA